MFDLVDRLINRQRPPVQEQDLLAVALEDPAEIRSWSADLVQAMLDSTNWQDLFEDILVYAEDVVDLLDQLAHILYNCFAQAGLGLEQFQDCQTARTYAGV